MNNPDYSSKTDLQPRLHHASAILADPILARTITDFANQGYRYLSAASALRWDPDPVDRLSTPNAIHEALGDDGLFAVLYDPRDATQPIACAATKRWTHDLEGVSVVGERGWEIKIVTTRVECMRRGLAGRCVDALVRDLVEQSRAEGSEDPLQVWVHAVEDLNGAYWRKKGWVEVRSYERPAGHKGSKFGHRLLVLLQEFE